MNVVSKRNTQFTNEFSKEVWEQTYKHYTDEDVNDSHFRVASDLALAEKEENREYYTEQFLSVLENFQFAPGGRILSNASTDLTGTTMINCFVSGFSGSKQDSIDSIIDEVRRQTLILKSEGGYGVCMDVLRPRGAFIHAIANESPGTVKFLNIWDTISDVITSGSGRKKSNVKGKDKIRKGAMMVTESCWHPDIEEFITAKQTPGRLTKFNMSVLATDEFMEAIAKHQPWKLEFPDYELLFQEGRKTEYNELWNGDLKKWKERGLPVKVYKEFKDANELWDLIMKSAYNRNEPGIIFIDTVNRLNNLWYAEHLSACNPCGEQYLPIGGVCLLGSFNLTQFINSTNDNWDYEKLKEVIPIVVRMMDNVNDRTKVPLQEQKDNIKNKRRMGLGVVGYASALMLMKIRYGSNKALKITDELMEFISNQVYQASALLAKEKGCFPLFDAEKILQSKFIESLNDDTQKMIRRHGLRNSHLLSIQPTGNTGALCNNISGGLEPIVFSSYVRTVSQPCAPEGLDVPKNVAWDTKGFDSTSPWEWKREGDENILITKFQDNIWKFDRSRGLLKEVPTCDYAVKHLTEEDEWDPKADWAACTDKLSLDDHIETMKIFSKYLDSAMSKTVNVPKDHPYEDFKRLYIDTYRTGTIKGCTVYREGTMTAVLASHSTAEKSIKISKTVSPKRPQILPCDIHQITAANKKWIVLVGLLEGDPYEVFAFQPKNVNLPTRIKKGNLIKIRGNGYNLECEDGWVLQDINTLFESDEHEALTRMISTALRHGTDIEFIVTQLMKSKGTVVSFGRAVGRTLRGYVQNYKNLKCAKCGSKNVIRESGCSKCLDCAYSGCE